MDDKIRLKEMLEDILPSLDKETPYEGKKFFVDGVSFMSVGKDGFVKMKLDAYLRLKNPLES